MIVKMASMGLMVKLTIFFFIVHISKCNLFSLFALFGVIFLYFNNYNYLFKDLY